MVGFRLGLLGAACGMLFVAAPKSAAAPPDLMGSKNPAARQDAAGDPLPEGHRLECAVGHKHRNTGKLREDPAQFASDLLPRLQVEC